MTVGVHLDDAVAVVTLARPERRNALDAATLGELHGAVTEVAAAGARAVVLTGAGDQFCAGADLTELEDVRFTEALRSMLDDLAALPVPTIAAISGACMGLGVQLAVACDLRLATADARFAVPVAKLGLMVDHWTVQRVSMLAGHSTARWMLLTARPVDAARAHQVGFVNQMVDTGEGGPSASVSAAATTLAREVATLAPLSLAGSKHGLDLVQPDGGTVDPQGSYRRAFEAAWSSEDLVEGRSAFAERRSPQFRGR